MKIVATTGHLNSRRCLAMPNELCHVQPSFWHFTSLSCAFVLLDAVLQLQNSSLCPIPMCLWFISLHFTFVFYKSGSGFRAFVLLAAVAGSVPSALSSHTFSSTSSQWAANKIVSTPTQFYSWFRSAIRKFVCKCVHLKRLYLVRRQNPLYSRASFYQGGVLPRQSCAAPAGEVSWSQELIRGVLSRSWNQPDFNLETSWASTLRHCRWETQEMVEAFVGGLQGCHINPSLLPCVCMCVWPVPLCLILAAHCNL